MPSWQHTGTHVLYKGAQSNNPNCIFLTNKMKSTPIFFSVGGKVMRKLCLTNPPLHLPDCRSDKSPLIWKIVLSREVWLIYARGDCFTQRGSHKLLCLKWRWVLISGSEQLAGGARLSLSRCWQASGRWPMAWRSVKSEVLRDELLLLLRGLKAPRRCSLRFVCRF